MKSQLVIAAVLLVGLTIADMDLGSYKIDDDLLFRLFEKEDADHDGKLTTTQFINGLISAFVSTVISS